MGTWYLPAVCQMGLGAFTSCNPVDNINDNLVQLGFGGLVGEFNSSTENSAHTAQNWDTYFQLGNTPPPQTWYLKSAGYGVRCAGHLTY